MDDTLMELYKTIVSRRTNAATGSYTAYLFGSGKDKILKKIGEEASEVIIAAKNEDNVATVAEISDLIYHLMVLMAHEDIGLDEVRLELASRSSKTGNLKDFHEVDKNT